MTKRIRVSLGRTFGTDNFGSIRAEVSCEEDVPADASEEAIKQAYHTVNRRVKKQLLRSLKSVQKIVQAGG